MPFPAPSSPLVSSENRTRNLSIPDFKEDLNSKEKNPLALGKLLEKHNCESKDGTAKFTHVKTKPKHQQNHDSSSPTENSTP